MMELIFMRVISTWKYLMLRTYTGFLFFLLFVGSGLPGCRNENSSPTIPVRQELLVYVAMGASDAVGVGAFPLSEGYVYQIGDGLQVYAGRVDLNNLGESGERISHYERVQLPAALAANPHIVTIWAGPNDVGGGVEAARFEAALERIFAALRQQSSAIIIMANVPDLTVLPFYRLFPDEDVTHTRIQAYNQAIARQCKAYGVSLIDLYAGRYAENIDYISIDGFHPSDAGHKKLAELYLEKIAEFMQ
jgi:lysophospholipase L1-like esterase